MNDELGEFLTRWSVRAAVACYVARVACELGAARSNPHGARTTKWIWTTGLLFYWLHVVCAFQFYHHWSHAAAYAQTARQTAETVGVPWGAGLYFNYLFTAVWTFDVAAWWWPSAGGVVGNVWYRGTLAVFFAFMFFNATVVFGPPFWKWLGIPAIAAILTTWLRSTRRRQPRSTPSAS